MRRRIAMVAGAAAVWAMSPAAGHAFERTPLTGAPAEQPAVSAPAQPSIAFDEKTGQGEPQKEGKSFTLPGVGQVKLPKLNFGLDLMYGAPETSDTELDFSSDPAMKDDDSVTIMGKVKRRF